MTVSTDVVNYPIKQFSLNFKDRNRNSLSHILITSDGKAFLIKPRIRKPIYTSLFRSPGQCNKITNKTKNMPCYW